MRTKNQIAQIHKIFKTILLLVGILFSEVHQLHVVNAQVATTKISALNSKDKHMGVEAATNQCLTDLVQVTLNSEQVSFCAPTSLPSSVVEDQITDPNVAYAQFNQISGYGVVNLKSIAPAHSLGIGRPVYSLGNVVKYRQEVWDIESSKTDRIVSPGPSGIFWNEIVPSIQIDAELTTSRGDVSFRSIEWYVEHNNRLWNIFITWDRQLSNNDEWLEASNSFSLQNPKNPNLLDTATNLGTAFPESQIQQEVLGLRAPVDVGTPPWWSGNCNDNNYFPYTGVHSFPLGSSWHGVPACGPRPFTVSSPDHPVAFFSGAHQELEFECVELVMRFLYQQWDIAPWAGNANQIKNNYPTSSMVFYPNGHHSIVPGDIITEDASPQNSAGHTAIITGVNLDSNGTGTISILEQNMSANGSRSLHVTNWNVDPDAGAYGQPIQGWLHTLSNQGAGTSSLYASTSSHLWQLDPSTGNGTIKTPTGYTLTDIAFDGKVLYGVDFSYLLAINPVTGARSYIGYTGYNNVNALTVAPDGTMYAGTINGALLRINKSTGAGTLIGYYGAGFGSSGDLAVRYDNTMYATVTRSGYSNDWLARININSGAATPIGDIGERAVFGLDFIEDGLYGVTDNGYLLQINPTTGGSTRIQTYSARFGGLSTLVGEIITPPGAATLVSPSGATTNTTPAYTWNKVNASTWYYLWVSRVNSDGSLTTMHSKWYDASAVCSASTCSITPAGVTLGSGNYRWWIQTWNDGGYGPWTSAMNFSLGTIAPPGVATLVSPSGATTNTTPAYTWNKVNTSTWYYLWVSRVNTDGSLTTAHTKWYDSSAVCGASSCSITPAGVTLGSGNYRWWIQTWNDGGYGPWSSLRNFSVGTTAPPSVATLVSPNGSITDTTPTYTWNKVNTSTWYYLWVSGVNGDGSLTTTHTKWYESSAVCGASTCSFTPSVTLGGGNYRWWIQTWNDGGYGPWSSAMNFSLPVSGFDSQFNGSAAGWQAHSGSWSIDSSQWYTSPGIAGLWASTSYNGTFSSLDYQARLWRTGSSSYSSCLVVRGSPTPLAIDNNWDSGYGFCYVLDGSYSIWKSTGSAAWTPLQNWTYSPSISTGAAWNILRIVVNGSNLYFYLNGALVWSGVDASIASGRVGIEFASPSPLASDQLWVDWATLSTVASREILDTISPQQQALNEAADAAGGDDQTLEKYQPQ